MVGQTSKNIYDFRGGPTLVDTRFPDPRHKHS